MRAHGNGEGANCSTALTFEPQVFVVLREKPDREKCFFLSVNDVSAAELYYFTAEYTT